MSAERGVLSEASFEVYMEQFVYQGYTLVSMILGYELELFDHLKSSDKPMSCEELADKSGCKTRYIEEWLNCMTVARIILVQGPNEDLRYRLPKQRYDTVVSTATYSKGVFFSYGRLEIAKRYFKKDGPSGDANVFHGDDWDFFDEYRQKTAAASMTKYVFPKLDTVRDLTKQLENGCQVLDVGCGSGDYTLQFAERYPNSQFLGSDQSEGSLQIAQEMLLTYKPGLNNICFNQMSIHELDSTNFFDVIICVEFLHNLPDPNEVLARIDKSLKKSGKLIIIEPSVEGQLKDNIGNMSAAYAFAMSQFICLPFSMSCPSPVGYGAAWNDTDKLAAIEKYAKLDVKFYLPYSSGMYVFTKKQHTI